MSATEYEQLLSRLSEHISHSPDKQADISELESRLMIQQAELMRLASVYRFPPPLVSPAETTPDVDKRGALTLAIEAANACDNALVKTDHRSRLPAFLPRVRPRIRNLCVYLLCALAGIPAQAYLIAVHPSDQATGWALLLVPVIAFTVGIVLVGPASTARLRASATAKRDRRPLQRDMKPGGIVCFIIGFVSGLFWLWIAGSLS